MIKQDLEPDEVHPSHRPDAAAAPPPEPSLEPPRAAPVDVRSVSLAVLTLLASLFALQWAKPVLIPMLLGLMMSYALAPAVDRLQRWHIPRALGATVLLTAISVGMVWGTWSLSDDAEALVETLPEVTKKIRQLTQPKRGSVSTLDKVQRAATELEAATTPGGSAGRVPPPPPPSSKIDIRGYLLSGTLGALALLGQISVVFLIALFLLASGSRFRRKIVKLAGPSLSRKRTTVETLDEISAQIQRYLVVQLGLSVIVGVATWAAFYAIGLRQAEIWGVLAGVTNLIPYVGAVLVGGASAIVGLVQFGSMEMAALVGGSALAVHALVGNLLAPWWTGRASSMNPLAVFIAVLVFGWLWGVWGLLLGVPVLMVVKAVCDRVDALNAIGELLGE
ncbi:AI-2E family transporter [Roseateles violae]|uniref:AI-2E family transporter n=1 Tax=Roseateles violae TaxID=3058042 RepID=A0ABT8DVH7_9BURK|nr:AI-2E family transporter [Pelomonas sp. PFR6]MDN3922310.1 AI-2E family transporter [Pelomonas sp. PFR6]